MNAKYRHVGRTSCRCIHCGWLVAAEGITLSRDVDTAFDENAPERCIDSACISEMVCDMDGRPAAVQQ